MLRIRHAEGRPEEIGKRAVLAEMETGRVVPHLGGAVLHRLERLQAGNEFAGGKHPH